MSAVDTVRRVLDTHGKLKTPAGALTEDDDLYAAGMTSHASVNVMLAVEDAFDIEFPDELLTKTTFCSIRSISSAVEGLLEAAA
ncbi:MAG: Aminoacyl carrier protein [Rhodoglobus sp.]|nr:Aminoacyl carrier protein [Rhodoglobus sp.]